VAAADGADMLPVVFESLRAATPGALQPRAAPSGHPKPLPIRTSHVSGASAVKGESRRWPLPERVNFSQQPACSFGCWMMAGADLF
jgi:hypothetical protein